MATGLLTGEIASMTSSDKSYEDRLLASDSDDWLSVRSISQHLFCHRAGVITHERSEEDGGFEGRAIRLGYLPRYDLRAIESMIGKWMTVSVIASLSGALLIGVLCLGAWLFDPRLLAFAVVVLLVLAVGAVCVLGVLLVLVWRLTSAKQTPAEEPTFAEDAATLVDWWGLQAAGFESQSWPASLKSDAWRLAGQPWGVLVRGNQYVPVFFDASDRDRLQKKHYARMAAYCLLLEREAGVESPFGVILRPGKTKVEAIPNTSRAANALADGAEQLRNSLTSVTENRLNVTPALSHLCADCPFGELKPLQELPPLQGGRTRVHAKTKHGPQDSICGVRFEWTPPHASAVLNGNA